jgi:hypothetical protein
VTGVLFLFGLNNTGAEMRTDEGVTVEDYRDKLEAELIANLRRSSLEQCEIMHMLAAKGARLFPRQFVYTLPRSLGGRSCEIHHKLPALITGFSVKPK